MKRLAAIAIFAGALGAATPGMVPADAPREGRGSQHHGVEDSRPRHGMRGGWMKNTETRFAPVHAQRLQRHMAMLSFEVERLASKEEELDQRIFMLERFQEEGAETGPGERLERLERMVDLQRELLELEKEELLFRVRTQSEEFLKHLDGLLERPEEELPLSREVLEKIAQRAEDLKAAAEQDFETLQAVLMMPDPATPGGRLTPRDQRLVEEIKLLKMRLYRLENELEGPPQFELFGGPPNLGPIKGQGRVDLPQHSPANRPLVDEMPGTDDPARGDRRRDARPQNGRNRD